MTTTPELVRGMRDTTTPQIQQRQMIIQHLQHGFDYAGYDAIDVPLLEHRDLYLRKSGDELVAKLYHWTQGGRELALRPEWTASVLRAVINGMGDAPQPLRLHYAGPVFRYERPRRATYRQFTQVGVELIGAHGARADAEILGLAVSGLQRIGIEGWTLTIGHIGIIKALLATLGLPERTSSALAWSLERIRVRGIERVRDEWQVEAPSVPASLDSLSHLADDDIETLLLNVLPALGVQLDGTGREASTIINRLVRKLRRADNPDHLERAWHVLEVLSQAHGTPALVLPVIRQLLHDHGLSSDMLDQLEATLDLLPAYGVPDNQIVLDFGMGRGLHYYTGLIFEIDGFDGLQLCGGGRYDDLVAALGGRSTPAVGFAYGLERVMLAAPAPEIVPLPSVLVVGDDARLVIQAAKQLRDQGYRAMTALRQRTLSAHINEARRRGFGRIAIVTSAGVEVREV